MKKALALLILLTICISSLSGCAQNTQPPASYAFEAQYIRTNCCDDMEFPTYALINSREELDAYYEKAISFTKKDEPKSESEAAELTKEQMREMERLNKKAMKEVKKSAKIKEESK